jgi:hypothetical protein
MGVADPADRGRLNWYKGDSSTAGGGRMFRSLTSPDIWLGPLSGACT